MVEKQKIEDVRVRYNQELDTIYIEAVVPDSFDEETEVNEPLDDVFSTETHDGKVYALEILNFNKLYPKFKGVMEITNIQDFLTPFLDKVNGEIKKGS